MPYWIDADPGLDDAIAILLAVREVGDRLVGISTVQGNVEEEQTARNLSRILSTYDHLGLTPPGWQPILARGARTRLAGGRIHRGPQHHGLDGLGNLPWQAEPDREERTSTVAAQAIVEAARSYPDLRLVCLGPLTNLALALSLAPDLPAILGGGLTIMGGSLRAGGNETMAAEFNFVADAEAASVVLEAGFRDLDLVTMDGCQTARLTPEGLRHLESMGTPAASAARELVGFWEARIAERGAPLYDPTAWLATTHPDLMRWESVYVAVDLGRDLAHGAAIADWRGRSGREPNLRAATDVRDCAALFEVFFGLLA